MLLLFVGNPDLTRDLSPPRVPRSQVSPEEVQKIVAGMDDPSALQAGGVHVGGEKYMFIQSDDRLVAAKKVRFAFRVPSIAQRTPPSAPRRTSPAPNPRPRHRPRATIPIQTPRRDPRASAKHPRPLPPRSRPLTPARRPRPRRRRGAPACSCARRPRAWSSAPTTRTSRAETATPAWVTSPIISSTTACDRFGVAAAYRAVRWDFFQTGRGSRRRRESRDAARRPRRAGRTPPTFPSRAEGGRDATVIA